MGVHIPTGYGQVTFVFQPVGSTQNVVITHGFKDNGASPDPAAAATDWGTDFTAAGRPFETSNIGTQWVFVRVDATIQTSTGPLIGTWPRGVTGTLAIEALPTNCAFLVAKATPRGGRRGRGRMFVPPFSVAEGNIGPTGTIASASLTAQQSKWNSALLANVAGDYPSYLLHDTSEIAPDVISTWTMNTRIATQRTRLRR